MVIIVFQTKNRRFRLKQVSPSNKKYKTDGDSIEASGLGVLWYLAIISTNLSVRSIFLPLLYLLMANSKTVLWLLLLLGVCYAQNPQYNTAPIKKGLTFQATVFPTYENNWAGRFSCNNCNPFEGDTFCNRTLPLLCLTNAKQIVRPLYNIAIQFTPFTITDGGYYDGWTGGLFQVTTPVQGSSITDFNSGNRLCKDYFGENAKWAQFDDGYYMPYMNQDPQKTWSFWDWGQTKRGGWNMWGYFNHHYRGRAWVWINNQPNANCGN